MFIKWPEMRRRWSAGEGSDVATSVFHLFRLFDNHTNHIATFPLKLADQRRFFFFFFFTRVDLLTIGTIWPLSH